MPAASGTEGGRVQLLSLAEAEKRAEEVGLPPAMARLNVFRTLLQHPRLAGAVSDLLLTLLFRSELDHRLRELVIMRIGWATGSDYEWTQHWPLSQEQFGCTREEVLAVRDWQGADCFGETERTVLAATDEMLATGRLAPGTWARCREQVGGEKVCLELVASIATWRWISQVAQGLAIPLEEGVASWPPDGVGPRG